jgi:hypothetical protein
MGVRRLAVGEPELAAEVPGRQVRAAGERLDVQRLRVLPVDPVADAAQPRTVTQVLRRRWAAGHLRGRATRAGGAAASAADVVALGQALDAAGDLVRRVGQIAKLLNELGQLPSSWHQRAAHAAGPRCR